MLVGRCLASQNRNIHPLFKILLLKSCLANIDIQVLIIRNLAMFHVNAFTKNVKIARKMIDAIRAWILGSTLWVPAYRNGSRNP